MPARFLERHETGRGLCHLHLVPQHTCISTVLMRPLGPYLPCARFCAKDFVSPHLILTNSSITPKCWGGSEKAPCHTACSNRTGIWTRLSGSMVTCSGALAVDPVPIAPRDPAGMHLGTGHQNEHRLC